MNEVLHYIAFFDLDRTITGKISGNVLAREAYKKGLMSLSDIIRAIWLLILYKLSLRNPVRIINEMSAWVENIPEKVFNKLSAEIAHKVLIPAVYQEALKEINKHRENGAKTVILSTTPAAIGREISKELNMDDFICSQLEVENGLLTGRSVGPLCYREEKTVRMKEYCKLQNCRPEASWYYGDSIADLPALSIVGTPVCVNPDRQLLKKARENGWKIYYWKKYPRPR